MMDSTIASPNGSIQDVSSSLLVQKIQQASINLHTTTKGGIEEDSRKGALSLAKELVLALEKPEDVVMRYIFELGAQCTVLRLGIDLRIFHILVEHEGVPVSASQLARLSKAELLLIVRIMRVVSAIGFAVELDEQTYMATPLTRAMTNPALEGGMKVCYDQLPSCDLQMLENFRENGYKCPTDSLNCGFQPAFSTKLSYFEHMKQNPERLKDFNKFMAGFRGSRKNWSEWFPFESEILSTIPGAENDILVVDVGGGKGHDLECLLSQYPQTKGRLVLQDTPETINSIQQLSPDIRRMPHDFFTPQPVKGARVYYAHFILHDWSDADCRLILRNLMMAMKGGYSKILLNEAVMPKTNCNSMFGATDMHMMAILGGMERNERQWIDLLQSVDLDVVKIWNSPDEGDEALIEAMLKS